MAHSGEVGSADANAHRRENPLARVPFQRRRRGVGRTRSASFVDELSGRDLALPDFGGAGVSE